MKRSRVPLLLCVVLLLTLSAVPVLAQEGSVMAGVGSDGGLAPATSGGVMEAAALAALAGALLAFAFERIPGLADWFDRLTATQKQAMMTLFLLVTALGVILWNDALGTADWRAWLITIFAAAAPNQATHRLVRK